MVTWATLGPSDQTVVGLGPPKNDPCGDVVVIKHFENGPDFGSRARGRCGLNPRPGRRNGAMSATCTLDDEIDYESDFESDCEDSDDEIKEELEVIYYEDEDEIHYGTGLPFWLLEAEAVLDQEPAPKIEQGTGTSQPPVSSPSSVRDTEEEGLRDGWPVWLLDAAAALGLMPKTAKGPASQVATATDTKPRLARSGSFERRRKPCADASNVTWTAAGAASQTTSAEKAPDSKAKITRSGSFERRRGRVPNTTKVPTVPRGSPTPEGTGFVPSHAEVAGCRTGSCIDVSPSSPATVMSSKVTVVV